MKPFSNNQLERYPIYLKLFKDLEAKGEVIVSSPYIAEKLGFSEELVRKDLQAVCTIYGRPRRGRNIADTIEDIEKFLGYSKPEPAILVGAGNLGGALLRFPGFTEAGLNIEAAFDSSYELAGRQIAGKNVYGMALLPHYVRDRGIKVAVLTVPAEAAQGVADLLMKNGIEAIWNFAPTSLEVGPEVILVNSNLASSLAVLSHRLREKREKNNG